ncbi:MAG: CDP-archaeol synthase [Hahellaceae bacterium]|nr:CDP-archaeol synthase [Hahellaceae bacterium]
MAHRSCWLVCWLPGLLIPLMGVAWHGTDDPGLGKSKTWRGVLASVCAGGVLGLVIDWGAGAGVIFAGCVMLGDLVSSFTKRRLNMVSSAKATFLDQVPESLLPLIYAVSALGYDATTAGLALVGFFVFETQISPLLFSPRDSRASGISARFGVIRVS